MSKKLKRLFTYFGSFNVSNPAASASFFIVLSIFPLLTLILSLLRYLPLTPQDLLSVLDNILPLALIDLAEQIVLDIYSSTTAALISITAITALWSASRGVFGILNGINTILGSDEHRSYIRRRCTAIFYTFLLIIALFLTLGLQVFGRTIMDASQHWNPWLHGLISKMVQLRSVFTLSVLALIFVMIYAFFPARPMHLRNVIPAALLAAIGWLLFSYFFSIYIDYGGGSMFYGNMAILVLAMLWLYCCMCILFFGAVICRIAEDGKLNMKSIRAQLRT